MLLNCPANRSSKMEKANTLLENDSEILANILANIYLANT